MTDRGALNWSMQHRLKARMIRADQGGSGMGRYRPQTLDHAQVWAYYAGG